MKAKIFFAFCFFLFFSCTAKSEAPSKIIDPDPGPEMKRIQRMALEETILPKSQDVEYILTKEQGTEDYYALPGKWVAPKKFKVTGEPVKITGEPVKIGSGH